MCSSSHPGRDSFPSRPVGAFSVSVASVASAHLQLGSETDGLGVYPP